MLPYMIGIGNYMTKDYPKDYLIPGYNSILSITKSRSCGMITEETAGQDWRLFITVSWFCQKALSATNSLILSGLLILDVGALTYLGIVLVPRPTLFQLYSQR